MSRASVAVSTVLALGLLLTACGGGEGATEVGAAQQCDGTLSPGAAEALERVMGAKTFQAAEGSGLRRTAQDLAEDHAKGDLHGQHPAMCEVRHQSDRPLLTVDFHLYGEDDLYDTGKGAKAPGRHLYAMGREAVVDDRSASLFVQCSSPELKGSERKPAPIEGFLRFSKAPSEELPPNTPATREAYLTVLHSVTLAVVKELGCENNAGLPERPVLTEKKWRGER
ncbi:MULTISPECIES: hypothetical protein [unclassified Streptomyces]|uniref:hypothetical protein n=1 Tax=unclassified Streptomyces TaxID=2593676 RepID=UPI0036A94170